MIVDKRPELTDELIELYCDWRTRCEEVREKYERSSDRSDPILPTGEFPGESRDANSPHR